MSTENEPQFKVGDYIKHKEGWGARKIVSIDGDRVELSRIEEDEPLSHIFSLEWLKRTCKKANYLKTPLAKLLGKT